MKEKKSKGKKLAKSFQQLDKGESPLSSDAVIGAA
jgi:hypothetical protein